MISASFRIVCGITLLICAAVNHALKMPPSNITLLCFGIYVVADGVKQLGEGKAR